MKYEVHCDKSWTLGPVCYSSQPALTCALSVTECSYSWGALGASLPALPLLGIPPMILYTTSLLMTHKLGSLALSFPEQRQVQPVAWQTILLECSWSSQSYLNKQNTQFPPKSCPLQISLTMLKATPSSQLLRPSFSDPMLIHQEFFLAPPIEIFRVCLLFTYITTTTTLT